MGNWSALIPYVAIVLCGSAVVVGIIGYRREDLRAKKDASNDYTRDLQRKLDDCEAQKRDLEVENSRLGRRELDLMRELLKRNGNSR